MPPREAGTGNSRPIGGYTEARPLGWTFYTLPITPVNNPANLFEKFFTKFNTQSRIHD
jgi:hypothetical protein